MHVLRRACKRPDMVAKFPFKAAPINGPRRKLFVGMPGALGAQTIKPAAATAILPMVLALPNHALVVVLLMLAAISTVAALAPSDFSASAHPPRRPNPDRGYWHGGTRAS
jgi:hypothetical protein